MTAPRLHRSRRWPGPLVVVLWALVACDGGATEPGDRTPTTLEPAFTEVVAVPGSLRTLSAYVRDAEGDPVRNVTVHFLAQPGNGSFQGVPEWHSPPGITRAATAPWQLPWQTGHYGADATAEHGGAPLGGSPVRFTALVESFNPTVDEMLRIIEQRIGHALDQSRQMLSNNQHVAAEIDAKIRMLEEANLASHIVRERRFAERSAESRDGRTIPLTAVFPAESMRYGATAVAAILPAGIPVIEAFMDAPIHHDRLRLWYGFTLGNTGGGGTLNMEDRETYDRRGGPLPYDAILYHELGHSYFGHESMTQFLELLLYNVIRTGSTALDDWTFTRGYTGPLDSNTGLHALLDIYQVLGYDGMARAYRAIRPLYPAYGQPLPTEARQAFVDEAPDERKTYVAAKADSVGV